MHTAQVINKHSCLKYSYFKDLRKTFKKGILKLTTKDLPFEAQKKGNCDSVKGFPCTHTHSDTHCPVYFKV